MEPNGLVERLLALYPAALRPLGPPTALGNAGGLSGARLWQFESSAGPLVARCWPDDGPGPAELQRIHGWLAEAGARLDFVPVPRAALDGRTLVRLDGRAWEVAPWRPGSAGDPTPGRLRAGGAALAAFHRSLAAHRTLGPSPGLAARIREIGALLAGGFDELERSIHASQNDPHQEAALRWCALARAAAPSLLVMARRDAARAVPLQPCLRDARPEHFLFEGDRLAGLVDFGAMGVESVAADLARWLGEWAGDDRVAVNEALAAYEAIAPLGPGEQGLISTFDRTAALLGGGRWVRWHFAEGRRFDGPGVVAGRLGRAVDRLGRLAAVLLLP